MINQQLTDYVKQQLQGNTPQSEIEKALLSVGWKKSDIDEAFKTLINPSPAPVPLPVSATEGHTSFLSVFELLKESWKIYKERFWKLMGILAIPFVAQVVFSGLFLFILGIIGVFSLYSLNNLREGTKAVTPFLPPLVTQPKMVLPYLIIGIISLLMLLIIQLWGQVALMTEAVSETKLGIKEAYGKSRRKIFRYLWLGLVSGFIIWGATILFVIPGIILGISFSMAIFILLEEDVGSVSALVRSRNYVKGHWWGVLGRIVFIGLVPMVLLSIPSRVLTSFFNTIKLPFMGSMLSLVLSLSLIILTPLVVVYLARMYRNLRELKGEVTPSRKSRTVYILLGFLGALIFPMGILSVALLGSMNPLKQMSKAQDVARKSDLKEIEFALRRYYVNNEKCPQTLEELVSQGELKVVPKDPKTKLPYRYERLIEGNSCRVCVTLEVGGLTCSDVPKTSPEELIPSLPSPAIY